MIKKTDLQDTRKETILVWDKEECDGGGKQYEMRYHCEMYFVVVVVSHKYIVTLIFFNF